MLSKNCWSIAMQHPKPPATHSDILLRNHVQVTGTGTDVLLYAHGFGCSQAMWSDITPAFATSHRQVVFDYVGSGQSDPAAFDAERYDHLGGYAQDLLDVCDALGLHEGVTFIGHSVSCSIGMLASLARPGLFKSMVLVGPNPCFVNAPPDYTGGFERSDLEELLGLMEQNFIGWANYLAPVVAGADGAGAVAGKLTASFCSTDPVMAGTFARATFFADNRADLALVQPPCLILQNRQDNLAPLAVGDYLHSHLRGSTLRVLDVSGHCAHMSHPDLVISAIREFA
jgi:sigma-B regulation protein RsbQ